MTPRDFILDFVTKHTKENFERLNKRSSSIDEDIFVGLKKNFWVLDGLLGDFLTREDFKKLGYVISSEKDENDIWTTIYKFPGDVFIKQTIKKGDYQKVPYKFEFVKLVETTVVVKTYEPLKPHEFPKVETAVTN